MVGLFFHIAAQKQLKVSAWLLLILEGGGRRGYKISKLYVKASACRRQKEIEPSCKQNLTVKRLKERHVTFGAPGFH